MWVPPSRPHPTVKLLEWIPGFCSLSNSFWNCYTLCRTPCGNAPNWQIHLKSPPLWKISIYSSGAWVNKAVPELWVSPAFPITDFCIIVILDLWKSILPQMIFDLTPVQIICRGSLLSQFILYEAEFILERKCFFLSLCRMCISVFWGQERLTDRSISKRYLKSDIATRVEKSSTSRVIHALDTGFYWSSETLCMSILSLVVALEFEWKRYSSLQSDKKTLVFEYEFSFTLWEKSGCYENHLENWFCDSCWKVRPWICVNLPKDHYLSYL